MIAAAVALILLGNPAPRDLAKDLGLHDLVDIEDRRSPAKIEDRHPGTLEEELADPIRRLHECIVFRKTNLTYMGPCPRGGFHR
jgi:hypothetical protein